MLNILKLSPKLAELGDVDTFQFENLEASYAKWRDGEMQGVKRHNVYSFRGRGKWEVRIPMNKKHVVLAVGFKGARLCRFADAAIVFFWKYRQRPCRPVTDLDLNFKSLEQARSDIKNNQQVSEFLHAVQDEMKAHGIFPMATNYDGPCMPDHSPDAIKQSLTIRQAQHAVFAAEVQSWEKAGVVPKSLADGLVDGYKELDKILKSAHNWVEQHQKVSQQEIDERVAAMELAEARGKEQARADAQVRALEQASKMAELDKQSQKFGTANFKDLLKVADDIVNKARKEEKIWK